MTWENELKESIGTIAQLREYIEITPKEERRIRKIIEKHPMRITRYYMSLIDRNDPDDPISKMVVPSGGELNLSAGSAAQVCANSLDFSDK